MRPSPGIIATVTGGSTLTFRRPSFLSEDCGRSPGSRHCDFVCKVGTSEPESFRPDPIGRMHGSDDESLTRETMRSGGILRGGPMRPAVRQEDPGLGGDDGFPLSLAGGRPRADRAKPGSTHCRTAGVFGAPSENRGERIVVESSSTCRGRSDSVGIRSRRVARIFSADAPPKPSDGKRTISWPAWSARSCGVGAAAKDGGPLPRSRVHGSGSNRRHAEAGGHCSSGRTRAAVLSAKAARRARAAGWVFTIPATVASA